MYTVTFYSYRGGVGRTTALVNVATDLAMRGRKVLLVDFHLEAPGLSSFTLLRPEDPHPGLVEFVDEYLRLKRAPAVEDYLYQVSLPGETSGQVWVMPAGRTDEDYWQALAGIDWQDLYDVREGFVLFEDLKLQWQDAVKPDYVLIDAQPGISATSDIATRQLADAVVVVFVLDKPAPAGFGQILKEIGAEVDDLGTGRIDVHLVASKMPDVDDEASVDSYLEPVEADLDVSFDLAAVVPDVPQLWLKKQVSTDTRLPGRLVHEYRRLADALIKGNCTRDPDGARAFLDKVQRNPWMAVETVRETDESLDSRRRFNHAGTFEQIMRNFEDDAMVLAPGADCLFRAGRFTQAVETLDQAISLSPNRSWMLWQQASYTARLKLPRAANDLLAVLDSRDPQLLEQLDLLDQFEPPPPFSASDLLANEWPGVDCYVVSALRHLRRLAPNRLEEAFSKACVRQLSAEEQDRLREDNPPLPVVTGQDPDSLIRNRQWREAIILLEPQVTPRPQRLKRKDSLAAGLLAMAYWGRGDDDQAVELCRLAAASLPPLGTLRARLNPHLEQSSPRALEILQLFSLIFCKSGDTRTARELLEDIRRRPLGPFEGKALFSYWRCQYVPHRQFEEDCRLQLAMIGGAGIQPAFVGEGPSG